MPPGNPQNLIKPTRDQTAEERQASARKAGIASGASRRHKASITEAIHACLAGRISDEQMIDKLSDLGMELTYADAIALRMADKAASGDVEAARFVRDTNGEKPTDKHEVRADLTDLSSLSTEELLQMVADEVAED